MTTRIYPLAIGLLILAFLASCTARTSTAGPQTTPAMTITATTTVTSTVTVTPATPANTQLALARQRTVDAMKALTAGQAGPTTNSTIRDSPRLVGWFDVNEYFSVLDHLSMQSGYTLDYVYNNNGSGGQPYLYARRTGDRPFGTLEELNRSYGDQQTNHTFDYLAQVKTDGTAEAFFQYVVLRIMGGQFYLWWHAAYNDRVIICTQARLEDLFASPSFSPGLKPPPEVENAARQLDLAPRIELSNDAAIVRVITFTKWGGFAEETYTITRAFPHLIANFESKILVPWQINLTF